MVGQIQYYDYDSLILPLLENKGLNTTKKIEIYINNTLSNVHKNIGEFYSQNWKYDNDSRLVTVTIIDDLQEWQEIVINKDSLLINYNYLDLFYEIKAYPPSKFKFNVSQDILDYLSSIKETGKNNLSASILWAKWQEFCEATMLHILKNDKGEVVVSNHI